MLLSNNVIDEKNQVKKDTILPIFFNQAGKLFLRLTFLFTAGTFITLFENGFRFCFQPHLIFMGDEEQGLFCAVSDVRFRFNTTNGNGK
ncbi:hypothetical protein [Serratia marcescens]|uniref:hypothetical protein n=1 Tax=Serratia marcescens TaxID=615 RepID=UPI00065FF46D